MDNTTSAPLVAVVTPVYNGAPWLERTMACVQAQTYPNLVHVVLDNASTDDTPDVIARFQGGRVPILTQRNPTLLPQVPNWNAAVAMTPPDARYVKFLAADDLVSADGLAKLTAVAEQDPEIDFVTCEDLFLDKAQPHGIAPHETILQGRDYLTRCMRGEAGWLAATHVFFRATPERLRDPFHAEFHPLMDMEFIFRSLLTRKMAFVHEPLTFTRYTEGSITAASGGFRSFIPINFALFMKYGPGVLSEAEFERLRKDKLALVLRHVSHWLATGDTKNAASALRVLATYKQTPKAGAYLAALASWPLHKLAKETAAKGGSQAHITEEAFSRAWASAS
jgi:glycosyltransferase involved in cell wall biosynthesis